MEQCFPLNFRHPHTRQITFKHISSGKRYFHSRTPSFIPGQSAGLIQKGESILCSKSSSMSEVVAARNFTAGNNFQPVHEQDVPLMSYTLTCVGFITINMGIMNESFIGWAGALWQMASPLCFKCIYLWLKSIFSFKYACVKFLRDN